MIYVTKSTLPSYEEFCAEIKGLWDSHFITNMGAKHKELQYKLEDFLDVPHVTLYTNGHLALENAISIFEFPQGSEIITTPFTFASTTHAIVRNGCVPVFCDIKEDDYTLDPSKIEDLITDKTVAILPVHVYGNICDVDAIKKIANKYNLKVIYDAAHAFAEKYKGTSVARFGDISMFSFHATKVYNTIEGGALTYNDDSIVQTLNDNKNFGIRGQETVSFVGGNAKMNEFQACMGLCNLRHIKKNILERKKRFEYYLEKLGNCSDVKIPINDSETIRNYSYLPVLFCSDRHSRDDVFEILRNLGIYSRKYFYPLTSEFECYKNRFESHSTPVASHISNNILCLPLYPDLEFSIIDTICNVITK